MGARNPNFAGRDDELEQLRRSLGAGTGAVAVLAVAGMGGVGKTQLGVEHAWRRRWDLDTSDPEAVVGLVHADLGRRGRWLVVFDNATDPASLAPSCPPGVVAGC